MFLYASYSDSPRAIASQMNGLRPTEFFSVFGSAILFFITNPHTLKLPRIFASVPCQLVCVRRSRPSLDQDACPFWFRRHIWSSRASHVLASDGLPLGSFVKTSPLDLFSTSEAFTG